ncbi:Methylcrotonoyl-CoA carboxylase subunit alpha, mitochondrial [Eumeta japonica]|uniref:Methylcrotonoyl-CoA carboxylase subunit alpha, mitochondrial n=1 Tax=Eumeta variegata TaxID=151549 RepID=A0A4C1XHC3_EUMVA|nr:Methylcrotonoyl-CoA carboxylase subunit alpha, mitochondrial [Eumeta japonica]
MPRLSLPIPSPTLQPAVDRETQTRGVVGLETNVNFLLRLSGAPAFVEGDVHTAFIPQHEATLFPAPDPVLTEQRALQSALAYLLSQRTKGIDDSWKGITVKSTAWRPNYNLKKNISLMHGEKEIKVEVEYKNSKNDYRVRVEGAGWMDVYATFDSTNNSLTTSLGGRRSSVNVMFFKDQVHLCDEYGQSAFDIPKPKYQSAGDAGSAESGNSASSPTPGVLERILVKEGDKVVKGQPLFVVIAMKMEYVVRSPRDGVVAAIGNARVGEAVGKGAQIVILQEEK